MDLVFLQEVKSNTGQLSNLVGGLGFSAEANIDLESPSSPGTAVIWKRSISVDNIYTFVSCRLQVVLTENYVLMNVYAPSGSAKRQERSFFFSHELFKVFSLFPGRTYLLCGEWNCVLSPLDIEKGFGFNQKNCPALKDSIQHNSRIQEDD